MKIQEMYDKLRAMLEPLAGLPAQVAGLAEKVAALGPGGLVPAPAGDQGPLAMRGPKGLPLEGCAGPHPFAWQLSEPNTIQLRWLHGIYRDGLRSLVGARYWPSLRAWLEAHGTSPLITELMDWWADPANPYTGGLAYPTGYYMTTKRVGKPGESAQWGDEVDLATDIRDRGAYATPYWQDNMKSIISKTCAQALADAGL